MLGLSLLAFLIYVPSLIAAAYILFWIFNEGDV